MKSIVNIAIIGAGYAATLHLRGYKKFTGSNINVKYIIDKDVELAKKLSYDYGIKCFHDDIDLALNDKEIDIIDICTPPFTHEDIILKAIKAGKNIICEKPAIGYFSENLQDTIGETVSKKEMYESVKKSLKNIKEKLDQSGVKFMYAENFIYAPSIKKVAEIIRAKKTKLFFIKGEESLRGSSSSKAGYWSATGGGSLIRVGSHPLGGAIYLKEVENSYSEEKVELESVFCDTGQITKGIKKKDLPYHNIDIKDVEDFANLSLTYSDGSKVVILASDTVLGGTKNYIEVYGNNGAFNCNLTPVNALETYMLDDDDTEDVVFSEMLPTKVGWNKAFIEDEILRGYTYELQDFCEAVIQNREVVSNFDIASKVIETIYAAYYSAETNSRVYLKEKIWENLNFR